MTRVACPREPELLEALRTAGWPDARDPALRDHVAACAACTDLAAVVLALLDEHHAAMVSAPVPASGVVWWRAQMRVRQEAARAAARPITIAQTIGLACAVGILAGGLTLLGPSLREAAGLPGWLIWTAAVLTSVDLRAFTSLSGGAAPLDSLAPGTLIVLPGLTAVLLLAPLALYFARE